MQSHIPRKRFGQHFLEDQTILQQMAYSIGATTHDHLVEIGPGLAALTQYLINLSDNFEVVELDRDLVKILKERFKKLKIHEADALKFDFKSLRITEQKLRVVGNLPYNISTPLLFHLFDQIDCIQDMHFLLQKEVVDRLCAPPNGKHYGRLSVMAQYFCTNINLFAVGPEAFDPPPQVDSAFIRMIPQTPILEAINMTNLSLVVREAFNQRRKTLANSLKAVMPAAQLIELGIDPKRRAQELSVQEFVFIANQLERPIL